MKSINNYSKEIKVKSDSGIILAHFNVDNIDYSIQNNQLINYGELFLHNKQIHNFNNVYTIELYSDELIYLKINELLIKTKSFSYSNKYQPIKYIQLANGYYDLIEPFLNQLDNNLVGDDYINNPIKVKYFINNIESANNTMADPVVYSDINARFYLIESVQQVLGVFGDNCIVSGLEIINKKFDNTVNVFSFTLTPGQVICDRTFIEFPEEINFSIDVTLDQIKYLVLVVSFRYLRTTRPNMASISLKVVNESDFCSEWFHEKDQLVITAFDREYNQIESSIIEQKHIIVNGLQYEIHPFNQTINQLRPLLQLLSNQ